MQHINMVCGDTTKTVISLDLDLYEKCYSFVRTNSALKDKISSFFALVNYVSVCLVA